MCICQNFRNTFHNIELNYQSGFTITMAKEFDSCIILTDNLKGQTFDVDTAYLKGEIPFEEYVDKKVCEDEEEKSKPEEKKFY